MTEDEVAIVVSRTLKEFFADRQQACRCSMDMEEHRQHHQAVAEAIQFMKGVSEIKWGVLKAVVVAAVLGLFALVGLGVMHKFGG